MYIIEFKENLTKITIWYIILQKWQITGESVVDSPRTMEQKGMTFDHDFYIVVDKQCRTENAYGGHQHNIFI